MGDDHLAQVRLQRGEDSLGVFIGKDGDHADKPREVEITVKRCAERLGPVGIMGGIDKRRGRGAHALKAAGRNRLRKTGAHRGNIQRMPGRGTEEGFHRCKGNGRILGLMLAVQWQENILVHAAEALDIDLLATDRDAGF